MKQKEVNSPETQHEPQQQLTNIAPGEIIIGTVTELDKQGLPLVDFPGNPLHKPLPAVSTLSVTKKHVNRQVALLFANGDPQRPVIMGLIHSPLHDLLETYEVVTQGNTETNQDTQEVSQVDNVTIDGKRIVLEGKEEIVLKCGDASITLTKAGKILIRGKYLLNRSEGVNRIMGGSVQVN